MVSIIFLSLWDVWVASSPFLTPPLNYNVFVFILLRITDEVGSTLALEVKCRHDGEGARLSVDAVVSKIKPFAQ